MRCDNVKWRLSVGVWGLNPAYAESPLVWGLNHAYAESPLTAAYPHLKQPRYHLVTVDLPRVDQGHASVTPA